MITYTNEPYPLSVGEEERIALNNPFDPSGLETSLTVANLFHFCSYIKLSAMASSSSMEQGHSGS